MLQGHIFPQALFDERYTHLDSASSQSRLVFTVDEAGAQRLFTYERISCFPKYLISAEHTETHPGQDRQRTASRPIQILFSQWQSSSSDSPRTSVTLSSCCICPHPSPVLAVYSHDALSDTSPLFNAAVLIGMISACPCSGVIK